jgi:hypothetical protein
VLLCNILLGLLIREQRETPTAILQTKLAEIVSGG